MNLSLAITTYNRYEFTIESFSQVIDDQRIDDIIILDDCSTDGSFEKLVKHFKGIDKVRVMRQLKNRGMSLNKRDAISFARNEWVAIIDSDNVIGKNYVESIYTKYTLSGLHRNIIYIPEFAKPKFDYRKYTSQFINQSNVTDVLNDQMGYCCMNTCNYLVHRNEYLNIYEHNGAMKGTDTLWFSLLWLKSNKAFYVLPDMQYFHRVHNGSGFLKDIGYNMKQAEKVKKMIMSL